MSFGPSGTPEYGMVVEGDTVGSSSGEQLEVVFPYTQETWATIPRGTSEDVDAAVQAARRRFESDEWQSLTASERGDLLFDLADAIDDAAEELAELGVLGNGKPIQEMRGRTQRIQEWYRYFGGMADKIQGSTIPNDLSGRFSFTKREPYGVVGAITPWNSPLNLGTFKIAPALAAGNTVVLKPSKVNPVTTVRLGEIASEAGLPDGALNVVTGTGSEVGSALVEHEDVDKVTFTGGTNVGRNIGKATAEHVVPTTLELGGKSPNIVFPDVDIDTTVTGAIRGIFGSSGQSCVAGSRLFVHDSIHDEFVSELVAQTEEIGLGDPRDPDCQMGPIASREQYETITEYIEFGLADGATLETGGIPSESQEDHLYVPPTIFTDVSNDMRIAQEEIFGPVLSVLSFETEEEVIETANDSIYGLAAGVWTKDIQRAHRMIDALEAGVVWVNTYRELSYTVPFGGMKQSGIGRENGLEVMKHYTQPKSVYINVSGDVSNPFNPHEQD